LGWAPTEGHVRENRLKRVIAPSDNSCVKGEAKTVRAAEDCPRCRVLEREVKRLRNLLEEAERAGKRQAAPFSRRKLKKDPKKPGRKPGKNYGQRAFRPRPGKIDRVINVPLKDDCCPHCGGKLGERCVHEQFVSDIPRVEPTVTQFNIESAKCCNCGRRIQGRHPEQISDAVGAAGNQIGPNPVAMAIQLNTSTGASCEKIARFLGEFFGLAVSRSTLKRAFLRTGKKAEPLYERIGLIVRKSGLVYPDETGWKVGGVLEWLWAFVAHKAKATLYTIAPSRGFDVIKAALGSDYSGFLGRDGWAPYDGLEAAIHQLCNGHLIRRASLLEEMNRGGAVCFPRDLKAVLQRGLLLRDQRDEGRLGDRRLSNEVSKIEWDLDELITKNFSNDENRKLAAHIIEHREAIFTYLYHMDLEATNWPAEQAIRPAVVNRKMSGGGNRTERGARAQSVLMSALRTAWQRSLDPVKLLVDLLRSPNPIQFAAMALGP
jgi:transposase